MNEDFTVLESCALQLDLEDPLSEFRDHFYFPGDGTIYLDGNSLGLFSKEAEQSLLKVMKDWKELGILGWYKPKNSWFYRRCI